MASFQQEFIAHLKKKTDYCNVDIIKENSCKGELWASEILDSYTGCLSKVKENSFSNLLLGARYYDIHINKPNS